MTYIRCHGSAAQQVSRQACAELGGHHPGKQQAGDSRGDDLNSGNALSGSSLQLAYGLHTEDPLRNAAREQRYHWISNAFEPIPFGMGAARIYGALCAHVRARGRDSKPRRFDLLIAAVAVDLEIPLITRNENGFRGIHRALAVIAV